MGWYSMYRPIVIVTIVEECWEDVAEDESGLWPILISQIFLWNILGVFQCSMTRQLDQYIDQYVCDTCSDQIQMEGLKKENEREHRPTKRMMVMWSLSIQCSIYVSCVMFPMIVYNDRLNELIGEELAQTNVRSD